MRKFIRKIFKFYSYTLGIITPLFILNYVVYKRKFKQDDIDKSDNADIIVDKGLQQILKMLEQ